MSIEHQRIRRALRSLPRKVPPTELTSSLRVSACMATLKIRTSLGEPARGFVFRHNISLMREYFMSACSAPAVAGFVSAIGIFFSLAFAFTPTYAKSGKPSTSDPPTTLLTEPMLKYVAPIAVNGDAFVDVKVDSHGRIASYEIIDGTASDKEHLKRSIENNLLFTEFWPATAFGVPTAGTIRISYLSSDAVDVTE